MATEYWCVLGVHWAEEVRVATPYTCEVWQPTCRTCLEKYGDYPWDQFLPTVREGLDQCDWQYQVAAHQKSTGIRYLGHWMQCTLPAGHLEEHCGTVVLDAAE